MTVFELIKKAEPQDQVFAEKALDLYSMASRAVEEAESYIEGIQNNKLREAVSEECGSIL
jgi:hypothetical protein